MTQARPQFESTPLITPHRLVTEWPSILASPPAWALHVEARWTLPDAEKEIDCPDEVIVLVSKKHRKLIHLTIFEYAALCEMSRVTGISIVTNSNFGKPEPKIYVKMTFDGAPEDLMSIRRIIVGAGANEATKARWNQNDYRGENTYTVAHHHPQKDARTVSLGHVERLARQDGNIMAAVAPAREEAMRKLPTVTLPHDFHVARYMANISMLFGAVDAMHSGTVADEHLANSLCGARSEPTPEATAPLP